MPRRKHGSSPAKRGISATEEPLPRRKPAADTNEDPGGGRSRSATPSPALTPLPAPATPTAAPAPAADGGLNHKYLHKKFKKMASAAPEEVPVSAAPISMADMDSDPVPNRSSESPIVAATAVIAATALVNGNGGGGGVVSVGGGADAPAGSGGGKYVCSYCQLACAKPSVLEKHVRAHTNERPYPCKTCGFAFKTRSNLYKHRRSRAHVLRSSGEVSTPGGTPSGTPSGTPDDSPDEDGAPTPPPAAAPSPAASPAPTFTPFSTLPPSVPTASAPPPTNTVAANGANKIYKPKFHKASLYRGEEEEEDAIGASLRVGMVASPVSAVSPVHSQGPGSPSVDVITRHISRIISDNQAIVQAAGPDPAALWPPGRRQRLASTSSIVASSPPASPASPAPNTAGATGPVAAWPRSKYQRQTSLQPSDAVAPAAAEAPAGSKLALALLRPTASPLPPGVPAAGRSPPPPASQPLNLSAQAAPPRKRSYSESVAVAPPSASPAAPAAYRAPTGPISLSAAAAAAAASASSAKVLLDDLLMKQAGEAPSGSLIKELLIKAHAAAAAAGDGPLPLAASAAVAAATAVAASAASSSASEDLSSSCSSAGGGGAPSYTCPFCRAGFRTQDTLDAHASYYCARRPGRSPASAPVPSGGRPSPGPLLGATPLVATAPSSPPAPLPSSASFTAAAAAAAAAASPPPPKKRRSPGAMAGVCLRLDDGNGSCIARPSRPTGTASSLHLFGGEVQILDGAGERKTMRIEPLSRSRSPGGGPGGGGVGGGGSPGSAGTAAAELLLGLRGSGSPAPGDSAGDMRDSPHIVSTIARSGLHSGGTIVQVQKPTPPVTAAAAESPPPPGEPPRLLVPIVPNITAPNLSVPGIPAPLGALLGAAGGSPGVVTIVHGGRHIPYVPGMPGPNSLAGLQPLQPQHSSATPPPAARPLDLAPPPAARTPSRPRKLSLPAIRVDAPAPSSPALDKSKPSAFPASPARKLSLPKPPAPLPEEPKVGTAAAAATTTTNGETGTAVASAAVSEISAPAATVTVTATARGKFLRPTSLPLKPGTFTPKRPGLTPTVPLVSPETPRPRKSYGQLYLNGHAYTYLGLKVSTRTFYCTLNRPQPMYVLQSPDHPSLSMYSNWKVCTEADPNPLGLTPGRAMALYDSRHRPPAYSTAPRRAPSACTPVLLTHSSYWQARSQAHAAAVAATSATTASSTGANGGGGAKTAGASAAAVAVVGTPTKDRDSPSAANVSAAAVGVSATKSDGPRCEVTTSPSGGESPPKRVRIFDGGFESNEEYTYVRGRGRGRYVCEECGIRCKKPSMLKKHIRTHTDVRPFTCKHCNFSFKTKGNLTKHMKSKAHYKKCVELGISPVPTVVDESHIDEECLARQQALRSARAAAGGGCGGGGSSLAGSCSGNDDDDSDDNEDDDEDDEDDDDEYDDDQLLIVEDAEGESRLEREAARGLLSLSAQAHVSAGLAAPTARPRTYPYRHSPPPPPSSAAPPPPPPSHERQQRESQHQPPLTPTLGAVSAHTEREKLSRNSGLAAEPIRQRGGAAVLLPPQQAGDHRYYFPSSRAAPAAALELAGAGTTAALAPVIPPGAVVISDLSSSSGGGGCGSSSSSEDSRSPAPTSSASGGGDRDDSDTGAPMDLSSHRRTSRPADLVLGGDAGLSMASAPPRRFRILDGGYDVSTEPPPGVFARTPTTPASDILTPVAEPATLLASLCSSAERVPATPTDEAAPVAGMGSGSSDPAQATMLQAYLTERALQDARRKQLQHTPAGGVPPGPVSAPPPLPSPATASASPSLPPPPPEIPGPASTPPVPAPAPAAVAAAAAAAAASSAPELALLAAEAERDAAMRAFVRAPAAQLPPPPQPPAPTLHPPHQQHHAAPPPPQQPPPPRPKAEFLPPSCGPSPSYESVTEDGRNVCVVCNKVFSKPSQLRLHVNIHYFERPFRCESCAVSFRTKGHLQKHERSVSHQNKVSMNSTFGTPTTTNPRPFKCDDCKIAFRIHGHLAKHLRSKMHIMKLECVGKLPFGTYAEMEREGVSLNEIDTTDCENSLESLQMLAQRLYDKDPSKLERWEGEPVPPISGGDTSSDEGEPLPAGQLQQPGVQGMQNIPVLTSSTSNLVKPPLFSIENQLRPKDSETRDAPPRLDPSSETEVIRDVSDGLEMVNRMSFACPLCQRVFPDSGALQLHAIVDHGAGEGPRRPVAPPPPMWEHPPVPPVSMNGLLDHGLVRIDPSMGKGLACEVCRMPQPSLEALQKHLLGHAQPRPYVCDCCDAGFSSHQQLLSHREMHRRSPGRPQQ